MSDNRHFFGIRPVQSVQGLTAPPTEVWPIPSAYAGVDDAAASVGLSIGDPVFLNADNALELSNGVAAAGGGAADALYGVLIGFQQAYDATSGKVLPVDYLPSGFGVYGTDFAKRTLGVIIRADQWEFEMDASSIAFTTEEAWHEGLVNLNAQHNCIRDVSNAAKPRANPLLYTGAAGATPATTSTFLWHVVRLSRQPQDFSGLYTKIVVRGNAVQTISAGVIGI